MLPVIYSVARELKASLLLYGLPAAGAFLVMHALMPPHPGPVAAAVFDLIRGSARPVVIQFVRLPRQQQSQPSSSSSSPSSSSS